MYQTTSDYKRVVQAPSHDAPVYVDIEVAPGVTKRVFPYEGSVDVQKYNAVRRTCTFKVAADAKGDLVPAGIGDTLSIGSVARPYRGVTVPGVTRVTASFRNEDAFDTGTYTDTVVNEDGALTLG